MLLSEGPRLLRLAARNGNVEGWQSVVRALREEFGSEQVQVIPAHSVPALGVDLFQRLCPPLLVV